MITKQQLVAQCKAENPKIIELINDEEIELTGADYEAACEKWAEMRLEQIAYESEQEALEQAKIAAEAKLAALGLTTDDLRALGL